MQRGGQEKLKNLLQALKHQTKICKICFKEFDDFSTANLINKKIYLCLNCRKIFLPRFIKFKIDGIDCLSIYTYDDSIKSLLYQFKGCFDYELANIFLEPYFIELSAKYSGFLVLPAPSFKEDDQIRGFNHVVEMFKSLKLQMLEPFYKVNRFKQANNNKAERKKSVGQIQMKQIPQIVGRKILIVDDVLTTGSTIRRCIELVKTSKPKDIKVLVMSKAQNKNI